MIAYLLRSLRARLREGRALFALTVLAVALGIASVLSIQILNRSALAAFRGSLRAVSGDADLSVVPRGPSLPDSIHVTVLGDPDVRAAWPVYQVTAALDGRERYYLDVVGVDLLAPVETPWSGQVTDAAAALTEPGWVAIAPALAREHGWRVGSTFGVSSGSRRARLRVGALVDFQRFAPLASRKLLLMDLAQAQHLLGTRGELTQVDLQLAPGGATEVAARRLRHRLAPLAEVLRPEQRERRAEGLLRAFRLNLTALSLISLAVGFFLVHSATQAALVRRRAEFGILRACGATQEQVLVLILAEVALLGGLGVAIGLPLGWAAARANLDIVSATVSNLYLLSEIERLAVPPGLFALAAGVGLLSAAAGALGPARDLAATRVTDLLAALTLHERVHRGAGRLALGALSLVGAVGIWYVAGGRRWQPAGFALAVAVLLALPLVTPWVVRIATARLSLKRFGAAFSLRALASRLQTTSFAIASLAIAVAMLVGIAVMVSSFRRTVDLWATNTLQADIYITPLSWRGAGAQAALDDSLVSVLAAQAEVRAADRLRAVSALIAGRRVGVAGVDFGVGGVVASFPLFAGRLEDALRAVRDSGAVIITEPLARRERYALFDSLTIGTPAGDRRFPIAGISYDYSSENGGVAMDLRTFSAAFGPGPISSMALYLRPGVDAEAFIDAIRSRLPGAPLQVRSNRSLRREVLRVFDQTFAVTRLLQAMALLVAASAITLTLLILARERAAELALYRALGAGRRQVFRLFVGKGIGIGAFGLGLGALAGSLLAAILIFVINRAYFGWTIQVHWPWRTLAGAAATILAAATAAALYPAARASRTPATELSRDDL